MASRTRRNRTKPQPSADTSPSERAVTPSRPPSQPPSRPPPAPPTQSPPPRIAPRVVAVIVSVAVVALVAWFATRREEAPLPRVAPPARVVSDDAPSATRADLVLAEALVPVPDAYLTAAGCTLARRDWTFPGHTQRTAHEALVRDLGDEEAVEAIMATARCDGSGCVLTPPLPVLEGISREGRAHVAATLARYPVNQQYALPFRREVTDTPFSASPGLPSAAREAVARLTWREGDRQVFGDLAGACAYAQTDDERRAVVRAIHLPRSLTVSLRTGAAHVERLVHTYPPRMRRQLRAALDDAQRMGQTELPLDAVLPPWVRARVGRYPVRGDRGLNCFWTALHFFDGDSAEHVESTDLALRDIFQRYQRVEGRPMQFGDVMLFYAEDDATPIHAAVHLFAGVVFTKNGITLIQPWRIARVETLTLDYPNIRRIEVWRPQGLQSAE